MDIYKNQSRFKFGFVAIALLITAFSLVYTNYLVSQLADREEKLIDLYAQALKFAVESELDDDVLFYVQEVISANNSVPVIMLQNDAIQDYRNIRIPKRADEARKSQILSQELNTMKEQHPPIKVDLEELGVKQYIFYRESNLLYQLRYFPVVQLSVLFIFGFLSYLAFDYSKRAEQNRVWVGLAKETAHQLGTPISSLMAWIEYLKLEPTLKDDGIVIELEKDVRRLQMVVARFSSIGSEPTLKSEDVYFIVLGITNYLRRRISSKVQINIHNELPRGRSTLLNRHLFEWVVENISKNAVDAMAAKGEINITLKESGDENIIIDISDTGKGMSKSVIKKVFNPGFTTKKRGWGLGLTLAKRIIDNYHKGKLTVKNSELGKGTTFRIVLR